jgi:hypothetical protein
MAASAEYGSSANDALPSGSLASDTYSQSVSTSESNMQVMRKGGQTAPVVTRMVHKDSGRRYRRQELIEEIPPDYSPD